MAEKVTTISDLLHRAASSCLSNRLSGGRALQNYDSDEELLEDSLEGRLEIQEEEEEDEEQRNLKLWEQQDQAQNDVAAAHSRKLKEMQCFVHEVFDGVSSVKRAYAGLQAAHSPWDPDKMRTADAAVVAELRKLGRLRDRYRRTAGHLISSSSTSSAAAAAIPLRDAVAPYEATIEDLKREIKTKNAEIENLKEKLRSTAVVSGSGRKGRLNSRRVGCVTILGPPATPTPDMFETYIEQVKTASKSFTSHLLSLMRSARWNIFSAVRSIVDSGGGEDGSGAGICSGLVEPGHAKYALESYINRKLFKGFENETFYIDGSLGSLLNPTDYRRDCFTQFRDMRGMDPAELLGVLPTCPFGRFASKKYVALVPARLEEALFGSGEQRRAVVAGGHPRTEFYGEFLRAAKAVWLLHLLAFALDPAPVHFEASKGAEFQASYMESVVRFTGGPPPAGATVGFSVGPGFKLGSGLVVRTRVYVAVVGAQPSSTMNGRR